MRPGYSQQYSQLAKTGRGERGVGGWVCLCLWKVFSFGILGYVFLCHTSTSVYRENLTRFEDLLRLWLKTSPMMPFARV